MRKIGILIFVIILCALTWSLFTDTLYPIDGVIYPIVYIVLFTGLTLLWRDK